MKKTLIALLFVAAFLPASAKEYVDAKMLLEGSEDTLYVQLRLFTNMFYKDLIDELSWKGTLVFMIDGEKQKIKEEDIDYLVFKDLQGNVRELVSEKYTGKIIRPGVLYEKMYVGKISWYRDYFLSTGTYTTQPIDYFVTERSVSPGVNLKRELKFRTTDMPELKRKINRIKTDNDILSILIQYDQGK